MDIADPSPDRKMNLMDAIQDQFQNKPSDREIELIKLSTRAIHIIYQYKLKFDVSPSRRKAKSKSNLPIPSFFWITSFSSQLAVSSTCSLLFFFFSFFLFFPSPFPLKFRESAVHE